MPPPPQCRIKALRPGIIRNFTSIQIAFFPLAPKFKEKIRPQKSPHPSRGGGEKNPQNTTPFCKQKNAQANRESEGPNRKFTPQFVVSDGENKHYLVSNFI